MSISPTQDIDSQLINAQEFKDQILRDYRIAWLSRHASILARKEVLRGKAKFGIMGAGKELPQLALSKFFQNGDFRAGYYRDQTWALASGMTTIKEMFAILYSDYDIDREPHGGGRQMSSHFATRLVDKDGLFVDQTITKNTSADVAPTASQMGRTVGLALASKLYRNHAEFSSEKFSKDGNEVLFASIGDASTSEGIFWEAVNAIGVQQIPAVISVWDDGYGISVPKEFQTTKGSISSVLSGFARNEDEKGFNIFTVKAWDYPALIEAYERAVSEARVSHIPAIVHVQEVTQPQGHSTSGSHERYKSEKRLQWEKDFDGIKRFESWIIDKDIALADELKQIEEQTKDEVRADMKLAWSERIAESNQLGQEALNLLEKFKSRQQVEEIYKELDSLPVVGYHEIDHLVRSAFTAILDLPAEEKSDLSAWYKAFRVKMDRIFKTHLFSDSQYSPRLEQGNELKVADHAKEVNGYQILQACFEHNFLKHNNMVAFGEDVGKIGGVNQGFAGMQEKFGENRIFDVGIREGTIMGQAIGLAMRGFRPIAEIQYLDYLLYGLQQLSDELATLSYRTAGGQKAPVIIRTRGHRLEGIWHTGSPMQLILGSLRGMHVAVPRNMTQAAGFYNTLLDGDEPALVVEPLNAYRFKEPMPDNLGDYKLALGKVECLHKGSDVTLVTYGACVKVAMEAIKVLSELDISVELIDVQTLLPFDVSHDIVDSIKRTNKVVFLDEDFSGGATAFMMQHVLESQGGYQFLDSSPICITAEPHRAGYGAENNYFSKPQVNDVIDGIYKMMRDYNPQFYPEKY